MGERAKKPYPRRSLLAAAAIVAIVLLIVMLTGSKNRLENVEIVRSGDGSTNSYYSNEDIIRAAGIKMNSSVNAVEDREDSIRAGIDSLGFLSFEKMERSQTNAVTLYIRERTPCIAVATGSSYIVIDREGYIIGRFDDLDRMNILKVNGITVVNPVNGSPAVTEPRSLITNALEVGCAVTDNNFADMVSNLSVYNDTYRLIMDSGMIVRFYMGDNLDDLISIVRGFFAEGITTGEVIVSGGHAALNQWNKDSGGEY